MAWLGVPWGRQRLAWEARMPWTERVLTCCKALVGVLVWLLLGALAATLLTGAAWVFWHVLHRLWF